MNSNTAKEKLGQFKFTLDEIVEKNIQLSFSPYEKDFNKDISQIIEIYKTNLSREGKRVRGAFSFYSYKLLGGTDESSAFQLAYLVEVVQAYLLSIDDFIDKSPQRRGYDTAHVSATKYYLDNQFVQVDPQHFGNSIAILCGLIGNHIAQIGLTNLKTDHETLIRLQNKLNDRIIATALGETLDVVNAAKVEVSEKDILDMFKWKTAVYTYQNPIHMGAILAGADDKLLDQLTEFAIPAGIAFQIQDDILGMFGEPDETGKSNMDDLKEGKITLLTNHLLLNGTETQKEILKKYLGNPNINEDNLREVQNILIDAGSLEYSKNKASELVKEAKDKLNSLRQPTWDQESFIFISDMFDYMINRKK